MNRDGNAEHYALLYLHERWVREIKLVYLFNFNRPLKMSIIAGNYATLNSYFSKKNIPLILKSSCEKVNRCFSEKIIKFVFILVFLRLNLNNLNYIFRSTPFKHGMVQLVICISVSRFEPARILNR